MHAKPLCTISNTSLNSTASNPLWCRETYPCLHLLKTWTTALCPSQGSLARASRSSSTYWLTTKSCYSYKFINRHVPPSLLELITPQTSTLRSANSLLLQAPITKICTMGVGGWPTFVKQTSWSGFYILTFITHVLCCVLLLYLKLQNVMPSQMLATVIF